MHWHVASSQPPQEGDTVFIYDLTIKMLNWSESGIWTQEAWPRVCDLSHHNCNYFCCTFGARNHSDQMMLHCPSRCQECQRLPPSVWHSESHRWAKVVQTSHPVRKGWRNSLIKEVEAGRGEVGGEWVSVFMCLKGLTKDKELVLFCVVIKGEHLLWDKPLLDPRKKYLIQGAMICLKEKLWIWRKVQLFILIKY